jgi:DNA-binding XRE family transcriptional regulator
VRPRRMDFLTMPGKTQNPDSWFYKARARAGFKTRLPFAQRLGVSQDTVYLWELGKHRPPWELMRPIADALTVSLPDVVEALWEEKIGDLCLCCGGTKVFDPPEGSIFADADQAQLRHARMLPIALPCANANCKEACSFYEQRVPVSQCENHEQQKTSQSFLV